MDLNENGRKREREREKYTIKSSRRLFRCDVMHEQVTFSTRIRWNNTRSGIVCLEIRARRSIGEFRFGVLSQWMNGTHTHRPRASAEYANEYYVGTSPSPFRCWCFRISISVNYTNTMGTWDRLAHRTHRSQWREIKKVNCKIIIEKRTVRRLACAGSPRQFRFFTIWCPSAVQAEPRQCENELRLRSKWHACIRDAAHISHCGHTIWWMRDSGLIVIYKSVAFFLSRCFSRSPARPGFILSKCSCQKCDFLLRELCFSTIFNLHQTQTQLFQRERCVCDCDFGLAAPSMCCYGDRDFHTRRRRRRRRRRDSHLQFNSCTFSMVSSIVEFSRAQPPHNEINSWHFSSRVLSRQRKTLCVCACCFMFLPFQLFIGVRSLTVSFFRLSFGCCGYCCWSRISRDRSSGLVYTIYRQVR